MAIVTTRTIPLFAATALVMVLLVLTTKNAGKKGSYTLMALFGSIISYVTPYSLFVGTGNVLWEKLHFLGIATAPVAIFVFALMFTGRSHLVTRRNVAKLSLVPSVTQLIIWTNGVHGLFGSFAGGLTYGPYFFVHAGYSYVLTLGAVGIFAHHLIAIRRTESKVAQSRVFLLATVFPAVGSFLTVSGLNATLGLELNLTPYALVVTAVLLSAAIFYY